MDDAVPARSRPWIDADDLHGERLGASPDVSFRPMPGDIWLTFPDGTEHELKESVTIGRDASSDLAFESATVSREHAALTCSRREVVRRGSWQLQRDVPERNARPTGSSAPAPPRRPDRYRLGDRPLLLAGAAAGSRNDGTARGGRTCDVRATVGLPAPGRAVSLRAVACRGEPRKSAVERADRGATGNARRDRHGQSGAASDLRKGRPLRPAGAREASSSLPRRPATRLGLTKERGSRSSLVTPSPPENLGIPQVTRSSGVDHPSDCGASLPPD